MFTSYILRISQGMPDEHGGIGSRWDCDGGRWRCVIDSKYPASWSEQGSYWMLCTKYSVIQAAFHNLAHTREAGFEI